VRRSFFCIALLAMLVPAARAADDAFRVLPNLSDPYDVTAVAISPDNRLVASIGNTLRVWDYERGRLVAIIDVENDPGDAVLFSNDSRYLIYGTNRGQIEVYDLEAEELVLSFTAHEQNVQSLDLNSTGEILLSTGALDKPKFWRLETGEFLAELDVQDSGPATFLAKDLQVALKTGDGKVAIYSTETGVKLRQIPVGEDAYTSFALSPDETKILVKNYGKLSVWDFQSGAKLRDLKAPDDIIGEGVAWLPDSRRAVTSGYRQDGEDVVSAIVWDAETGERLLERRTLAGAFQGFVIGPKGETALSGSESGPSLFEWPLLTSGPGRVFGALTPDVKDATFVDRQKIVVAAGSDKRLRIWGDDGQLRHVTELGLIPQAVAATPDETAVAVAGFGEAHVAELVDLQSLMVVQRYGTSGSAALAGAVDLTFSPDGEILYCGLTDGTVRAWRVRDGTEVAVFGTSTAQDSDVRVNAIAIAPGGDLLAVATARIVGSDRDAIELWDIASKTRVRTLEAPIGGADDLAFDAEGKRLVGASGWREVRIWNVETGNLEKVIEGLPGNPLSVAMPQTGKHLFIGTTRGDIRKVSRTTGRVLEELDGHTAAIEGLALNGDGSRLLSASRDGTVRLWDTADGRELVTMTAGSEGWLSLTPQGFFTASGNGGQLLSVVNEWRPYAVEQFGKALFRPDLVAEWIAGDPKRTVQRAADRLDLGQILESGTAPDIRVLTSRQSDGTVEIAVALKDTGGGIGELEWRVNGIAQSARGAVALEGAPHVAADEVPVMRRFELLPGSNRISVAAYTANNLLASERVQLVFENGATGEIRAGRLFVLAIGIDDYADTALSLRFAAADASAFADSLKAAAGSIFDDIVVKTLLNADATERRIGDVFAELEREMDVNDKFVLFVAGHGYTLDGTYYFVPQDFGTAVAAISQQRWQSWIDAIPAQASILIYDTCESGTLVGTTRDPSGSESAAFERLNYTTGRSIISAATGAQAAAEGYRDHGLLTWVLLDALVSGDRNGDGLIDVSELGSHAEEQVPVLSASTFGTRQQPRKLITADFPIARRQPAKP
jgi:WD40 repeat protein